MPQTLNATPPGVAAPPRAASQRMEPPNRQLEGPEGSVYLFDSLNREQRSRLVSSMRPVELRRGQWLFSQGDLAQRFYFVRSGQIVLFRQSQEGEEKIFAVIEPGETFGEGPVFVPDGVFALNARAVTDCTLSSYDNQEFRAVLSQSVELCFKLMATLRRREGFLLDEIEQISLQSATQRVVAYLLQRVNDLGSGDRVTLSIPKHILASRLTIKPETLSRVLASLRERKLIELEGDSIAIVGRETLEIEHRCFMCGGRSWGCPGPDLQGQG